MSAIVLWSYIKQPSFEIINFNLFCNKVCRYANMSPPGKSVYDLQYLTTM